MSYIMEKLSFELGRISGILEGLAQVNNKTNHGFTFDISLLGNVGSIESLAQDHLKKDYPDSEISFSSLKLWKKELSQCLEKWLFCYQPQKDTDGKILVGGCGSFFSYLKDIDNSFSLSHPSFRSDFLMKLCDSLDSMLDVVQVLEVKLQTKSWYECDWNDYVIEGRLANVFLHFGVSD